MIKYLKIGPKMAVFRQKWVYVLFF